jgi:hypothetical protein
MLRESNAVTLHAASQNASPVAAIWTVAKVVMARMMLSQQVRKTETMQPMMLRRRRLAMLRTMATAVSTKLEKHREPNEVVRLCFSASNVLPWVTPP